ncbi:RNA polymerase sigma factor [Neobacillus sp. D3-1R]|uniref:RNA polymerase sigma factor n=1 Tax=Neobacillus sp. D3-1R TaxID=3445778 RepID=UPI003F9F7332
MFQIEHTQYLIKQIQNGNQDAYTELIHPLIEKAYKTSYYLLKSKEYAEEVVQTAMIEAYSNIMQGKEFRNFPAWFHKLVSSRTYDLIRRVTRERKETLDVELTNITLSQTTFDHVVDSETKHEISDAVLSLEKETYRNVIVMYYYQDLSISEIAEIMNLNKSTVKTHLRRARESMGKKLKLKKMIEVN